MLPERRCAFINYTQKAAAEAAYAGMQVSQWWAPCRGAPQPLRGQRRGGRQCQVWDVGVPALGTPPPTLSLSLPLLSSLSLPQDAEVEGSRLVLQLKHPSHATPAPRWHSEPRGEVGALTRGLL